MKLKLYQVDAFTDKVFSGNPAAVCPLDSWLEDDLLQKIAMENNLAETAFYVKNGDAYEIRWFTPTIEVDLCGHATLASAFVLFNYQSYPGKTVKFKSRKSGVLSVERDADLLKLNFPTDVISRVDLGSELKACVDKSPAEAYKGKTDFMLVFERERDIRDLKPVFNQISILPARGLIVTAPGDNVDFVSRFFAPQSGINEDPVTGSAHTTLIPYWSKTLGKTELTAMQLSQRIGHLKCKFLNERVEISGKGKEYLVGEIFVE
ncbi:MAG TPA: PhzF family phenazine biosynthesis protein [Chryseolinea sp.]|nr:PhzF family phenazine biosynthesis protein [Chryseolinea sp.]